MTEIKSFTFNPFGENTIILWDETKQCAIIDAGMTYPEEEQKLKKFIEQNNLTPVLLLNTHCHIDHILGNHFIYETYRLKTQFHPKEMPIWAKANEYAPQFGMRYTSAPSPEIYLEEGKDISFGNTLLNVIFAPGHAPGHVCFYHPKQNFLIAGDVLFYHSIGRTDLPLGDYDTLIHSIKTQLMALPNDCTVHPGHGITTTIGEERKNNPFLLREI